MRRAWIPHRCGHALRSRRRLHVRPIDQVLRHMFGVARAPCAPHETLACVCAELRRQRRPKHDPVDRVTPVFLGAGHAALVLDAPVEPSPSAARRHPHPRPLLPGSHDMDQPARFVGQHHDLARLKSGSRQKALPSRSSRAWGGKRVLTYAGTRCLAHLAQNLTGSGSRMLLTSRHWPAARAAPGHCLWVALGPLPPEEAVLLVQEHKALPGLFFSADPRERALAERLLEIARGHAFILDWPGSPAIPRRWPGRSTSYARRD